MRRYLIYYCKEIDNQDLDLEIIVKADDMEHALKDFKKEIKDYKSITTITELVYA
jgi:hypothetical protein